MQRYGQVEPLRSHVNLFAEPRSLSKAALLNRPDQLRQRFLAQRLEPALYARPRFVERPSAGQPRAHHPEIGLQDYETSVGLSQPNTPISHVAVDGRSH